MKRKSGARYSLGNELQAERQGPERLKRRNPLKIKGLRVRLSGLEPETNGLKVRCSTN